MGNDREQKVLPNHRGHGAVRRAAKHRGLGPDGSWKTGQRVPDEGFYVDQYGVTTWHWQGATFPPCVGRKGECAFRRRVPRSTGSF